MKVVTACYNSIGMFDTRVGDVSFHQNYMFLPVSNLQLDTSCLLNQSSSILILDYAYILFKDVILSTRDVYMDEQVFKQILLQSSDTHIAQSKYQVFEFEFVDFRNPTIQYYNWIIMAQMFYLVMPDYASLHKSYVDNNKIEKEHFYRHFNFEKFFHIPPFA